MTVSDWGEEQAKPWSQLRRGGHVSHDSATRGPVQGRAVLAWRLGTCYCHSVSGPVRPGHLQLRWRRPGNQPADRN